MHPQSVRERNPSSGNLPLHTACSNFSWKLSHIKQLFELYPDAVAIRNVEGSQIVIGGIEGGGRYPLHEFLSIDRYFDVQSVERKTAALDTVMFLVNEFPASVRVTDNTGRLPLHYACMNYHVDIVKYLANAYPDGTKVESLEFGLPLHCACASRLKFENLLPVITHLLKIYPKAIGIKNETVGFPVECSTKSGCVKLFAHSLVQRYPGKIEFILHRMLQDDDLLKPDLVVQTFLKKCPGNVTQVDNFGQYPLHVAVSSSRMSYFVVRKFLEVQQAAALHQDRQGCIPLHLFWRHSNLAKAEERDQILTELLSKGPNSAEIVDNNGSLPLHYACRYDTPTNRLLQLINSYPEAVTVSDRNGCIPLHVACRRGMLSVDVITTLLSFNSATIQAADKEKELPLHKACRGGHLEIIHYLLDEYPPASGMRNASGLLPIEILCRKSGKGDMSIMDEPVFTETIFRLLRAHPEAVMA